MTEIIKRKQNEDNPTIVHDTTNYCSSQERKKEEKKKKLGFNDLTPSEWALLSKNVITEDDLFNPVWNNLSSPRNEYQKAHGAVFPVKLAERLIKMYSKTGDIVFDPCMGSGSTGVVCINTGRNFIGIEKDEKYFNVAKTEYQEGKMQEAQFINVIECITKLSSTDTSKTLSGYLAEMNKQAENNNFPAQNVVLTVIKSLGALGDKSAFDNLLYVTYLNYPEEVKGAARDSLAKLKW